MLRLILFILILAVGMPVLWAFIRHAETHGRVSIFGFSPTSKADDPKKFNKVVRSYRMQLFCLPIIAALVAAFMEIPD